MYKNQLIMIALLICSLATLPSCQVIKDQAKAAVTQEVGDLVAKKLPAENQAEFRDLWEVDKGAATKYAAEIVGIDKLADIVAEADAENVALNAQNRALADQIRAGGSEVVKTQWAAIAMALLGTGGTLFGISKRNKWVKVLRAVIGGVGAITGDEVAPVKKAIEKKAKAAGVAVVLDKEIAKVTGA